MWDKTDTFPSISRIAPVRQTWSASPRPCALPLLLYYLLPLLPLFTPAFSCMPSRCRTGRTGTGRFWRWMVTGLEIYRNRGHTAAFLHGTCCYLPLTMQQGCGVVAFSVPSPLFSLPTLPTTLLPPSLPYPCAGSGMFCALAWRGPGTFLTTCFQAACDF